MMWNEKLSLTTFDNSTSLARNINYLHSLDEIIFDVTMFRRCIFIFIKILYLNVLVIIDTIQNMAKIFGIKQRL